MQWSIRKRFAQGFQFDVNYTWSKSIDAVSYSTDLDGINVINPYKVRAYRGLSDYNSPQRFLVNYVWQLPGPKQGWQRFALGGWETSGIWTIQTSIFPENRASLVLHEHCGFRVVGTRERIAKRDGVWRDTVFLERRSEVD